MKKVTDISVGSLQFIYQKLQQLKHIQTQVAAFLPDELQPFCQIANFEKGILTFAVANAAWATRLRYMVPELVTLLRQNAGLSQLAAIHYYIEPAFTQIFSCK